MANTITALPSYMRPTLASAARAATRVARPVAPLTARPAAFRPGKPSSTRPSPPLAKESTSTAPTPAAKDLAPLSASAAPEHTETDSDQESESSIWSIESGDCSLIGQEKNSSPASCVADCAATTLSSEGSSSSPSDSPAQSVTDSVAANERFSVCSLKDYSWYQEVSEASSAPRQPEEDVSALDASFDLDDLLTGRACVAPPRARISRLPNYTEIRLHRTRPRAQPARLGSFGYLRFFSPLDQGYLQQAPATGPSQILSGDLAGIHGVEPAQSLTYSERYESLLNLSLNLSLRSGSFAYATDDDTSCVEQPRSLTYSEMFYGQCNVDTSVTRDSGLVAAAEALLLSVLLSDVESARSLSF